MKIRFLFFVLMFSVSNLFAQGFEFVFENSTSSKIDEIYCAGNGDEWSDNLIEGYLDSGESTIIFYMPPYEICSYDFIAIGLDETRYVFHGIDLCETTHIVFYDLYREGNDHGDEWAGEYSDDESYAIDGDIKDVITYNDWRITQDGNEYGTLRLNPDGSAVKTSPDGGMISSGNWNLDESGYYLTLHFPDEGQASTGKLNYRGNEMDLLFNDGGYTYQWLLIGK